MLLCSNRRLDTWWRMGSGVSQQGSQSENVGMDWIWCFDGFILVLLVSAYAAISLMHTNQQTELLTIYTYNYDR
jgi:hypothetical protein